MKKKVTAIIAARMGSNRLPGKVLMPLETRSEIKPALVHLIERVKRAKTVDDILLITTMNDEDDILVDTGFKMKCNVHRGGAKHVLDNILAACMIPGLETIVDITADCPLIDPKHIDIMVKFYHKHFPNYTYVCNVLPRSYPRGFDLQVYSSLTLKLFSNLITDEKHRNHSGWNIMIREKRENMFGFVYPKDYSSWRLCIDEMNDYVLMKAIFSHFKNNKFSCNDVIKLLEEKPYLLDINKDVRQKEAGRG